MIWTVGASESSEASGGFSQLTGSPVSREKQPRLRLPTWPKAGSPTKAAIARRLAAATSNRDPLKPESGPVPQLVALSKLAATRAQIEIGGTGTGHDVNAIGTALQHH